MSISPETYLRKPFEVRAVQVTVENIVDIAHWCKGELVNGEKNNKTVTCIQVKVSNPISDKQTRAFVGDWVLRTKSGWKVYTNKAFRTCFERPETKLGVTAEELLQDSLPGI